MYDYIKGNVTAVHPYYITIENAGIGYQLQTPNPYVFQVSDQPIKVYTYLHVREDTHSLIGFQQLNQRHLFEKLITVSGIGPKGALAIVANGVPEQVVQAIEMEDEKFLVQFPGVGKKTARQMILDLKGKLTELFEPIATEEEPHLFSMSDNHQLDEALLALEALGYSARELAKIKQQLAKEDYSTEEYMKQALQLLVKQR